MSRLVTRSAARTIRGCQEKTRSAGGNIRKLRKSKRLTLEQLAEKAESNPKYLGGVERGEENIGLRKLEQVAAALRVNPYELLLTGDLGELTDELIASIKTADGHTQALILDIVRRVPAWKENQLTYMKMQRAQGGIRTHQEWLVLTLRHSTDTACYVG